MISKNGPRRAKVKEVEERFEARRFGYVTRIEARYCLLQCSGCHALALDDRKRKALVFSAPAQAVANVALDLCFCEVY